MQSQQEEILPQFKQEIEQMNAERVNPQLGQERKDKELAAQLQQEEEEKKVFCYRPGLFQQKPLLSKINLSKINKEIIDFFYSISHQITIEKFTYKYKGGNIYKVSKGGEEKKVNIDASLGCYNHEYHFVEVCEDVESIVNHHKERIEIYKNNEEIFKKQIKEERLFISELKKRSDENLCLFHELTHALDWEFREQKESFQDYASGEISQVIIAPVEEKNLGNILSILQSLSKIPQVQQYELMQAERKPFQFVSEVITHIQENMLVSGYCIDEDELKKVLEEDRNNTLLALRIICKVFENHHANVELKGQLGTLKSFLSDILSNIKQVIESNVSNQELEDITKLSDKRSSEESGSAGLNKAFLLDLEEIGDEQEQQVMIAEDLGEINLEIEEENEQERIRSPHNIAHTLQTQEKLESTGMQQQQKQEGIIHQEQQKQRQRHCKCCCIF